MAFVTIRVQVNEDGMTRLHDLAVARGKDPEAVAHEILRAALKDLPTDGRYVVVSGLDLEGLETILSGGSVLNALDLLRKVERLAGITFNNIRFEFTPGQLEEIQRRAERLGLTAEELCRRTVRKMEELFFTHLGVGAAGV
jgi:hypothetical protein